MPVIEHAAAAGKLQFFPEPDLWQWVGFLGAGMTMMLGSIPQQDVFQRITSARTARIALWGSIIGGSIYFVFTFVPMFIAYSATLIDPTLYGDLLALDSQLVLPTLVLQQTPVFAQAIFFGSVLAAIMSCSSATLLAPSVAFAENIVRGFFPSMGDREFLRLMRVTIVCFTFGVLLFALNSESSIFHMVENAYRVTLAGAFVPLVVGAFWARATTQGALAACIGGVTTWILVEVLIGDDGLVPPQLIGLIVSFIGMLLGSLLPQWVGRAGSEPDAHAALHHRAAAETHHTPASHH